ncbi:hypothetical protein BDP27DRAFT_1225424 [Rhodocollybia butyracea]|uniref:FAD/NAD(P)-binding domain-containing protein n=1 Tax=Rhodocollybia butyracea TaxID=206335 RepID=A0A9P5U693_9AGAR|nr:hypothetical protein BDP27DRAFT_1225424 [Rhodocollybia butyracea]
MYLQPVFLLSLLVVTYAFQQPFHYNEHSSSYQFQWPIRKVGIIGAGPGGLVAYRELAQLGFEVRVLERNSVPGGNWHYTNETLPSPVPNLDVSEADFRPDIPPDNIQLPYEKTWNRVEPQTVAKLRQDHQGVSPIWESLTAIGPKIHPMIFSSAPTNKDLQRYVRSFASFQGINSNDGNPDISYNTRVERVEKRYNVNGEGAGWTVTLREFIQTDADSYSIRWWTEDLDAILVASGRYNAPSVPNIPGLAQWAKLYPKQVIHSRAYRHADEFVNQTVLIIGGSVSGTEIAELISGASNKIFLSIRDSTMNDLKKILFSRVPKNVSIVPEIKLFHQLPQLAELNDSGIHRGAVELLNGTLLEGIDKIVLATGFRFSLPFLPQYQNSSLRPNETVPIGSGRPQPLITDGSHLRSLHMDLFYIEEPTLGFINFNEGIETFTLSEFSAAAIGKVWAGEAKLPPKQRMWDMHWQRLRDAGGSYTRKFMLLGNEKQTELIRNIIGWINRDACEYGGRQVCLYFTRYIGAEGIYAGFHRSMDQKGSYSLSLFHTVAG